MAKGEEVGPEEPDPTAQEEVGLLGLFKFIVYCLIFLALAGKFFTGSFLYNYEENLPSLKKLWPVRLKDIWSVIHSAHVCFFPLYSLFSDK